MYGADTTGKLERQAELLVLEDSLVTGDPLATRVATREQAEKPHAHETAHARASSHASPVSVRAAAFFIAANLAIGLFFSTLARTQQQAMQMSFFFVLPNILLSGFMFPWEAMPRPAQWLSQGLPLTHFLRIVRGITLKGSRFSDVSGEVLWLVVILGVLVVVTSLRFRKKLG